MNIRRLSADDLAAIEPFIENYPFKPYRNYRILSRRRQSDVMRTEVERTLRSSQGLSTAAGKGDSMAAAVCRPLPWDSSFFGVSMARLDYVLRGAEATRGSIADAVSGMLEQCRADGIDHVAARADVADTELIAALEDSGFRLMDALVIYIYHPKWEAPPRVKQVGQIRPMKPEDADEIVEITRDAYRGFRGRFHLDPHLSQERSDALYIEWARKCCSGQMADRVFVSEDSSGHLNGWAATRLVEPASSVGGARIFAGSLGACRRERPGAYAGLIRDLAAENHAAGALTETATQNYNISTVRVYEAVGAHYVRADYTFHAWLG